MYQDVGDHLYAEDEENGEAYDIDYDQMAKICIMYNICEELDKFLIACNIAYPFIFYISKRLHFIDGEPEGIDVNEFNCIRMFNDSFYKVGDWPKLEGLNLLNTYLWVNGHIDLFSGKSDKKLGIALCAFLKLIRNRGVGGYIDMLWAMIGIEAIFNDKEKATEESISSQIISKSQFLFGESPTFRKVLKKMYSTRSLFIHGNLKFPGLFPFEEDEEQGITKAKELAIILLMASIQKAVKNNWGDIRFGYNVYAYEE